MTPRIYKPEDVVRVVVQGPHMRVGDRLLACRAEYHMGGFRHRFRLAWMVFTGRADALTWPGGQ